MKTRLIHLTLACLLTPLAAQAQFTFVTNNGAITITRYIGSGGAVVIPDTTNGYPVVSIGANAFLNASSNMTSVTIPNSITSIGDRAFYTCYRLTSVTIPTSATNIGNSAFGGCSGLTSVTIPNSVTSIGDRAFYGCSGLTNISVAADNPSYSSANGVLFDKTQAILIQFPARQAGNYTIPNSVTNIGNGAFSGCTSLTNVTIPNGVTSIGQSAFSGCGLTSVTIPDSVTSMGESAFYYCTSLTNVIIGNGVTSIGNGAFGACLGLKSVTIGNSVTNIGDVAFSSCHALTSVVIGNSVTSIGNSAFYGCFVLTSVTIPNSVTSIGGSAFIYCYALTSVTIPNSVTSIGSQAFGGCRGLINISVAADNPAYSSVNGVLFDKTQTILIQFPGGRAGNYIIPNGVTRIAIYAFQYCHGLTSVTIPSSVTSIGDQAFYVCIGLTTITCLGNAPALGSFVFYDYALVYYYCGTSGWGGGWGGLPTVMLFAPRIAPGSAGVKPGGFGFTLTCLTNQTIVVEASANLVNWQPIWTNSLPGASAEFVDPKWLNHSNRFYRAR